MLLQNSNTKTEGTALKSYGFEIEDAGTIFGLLRHQMYSNQIESICREITCNGRDAHRELGTPNRPIKITFPTSFAPEIRFRDFGVGISPERMESIYSKYGNSTKRDSNAQTGGFGLGAKSPFSYVPSFTITTIVPEDGKNIKRIYCASVGEDRKGGVHLLAEQETKEERGTEIAFVVAKKDFDNFQTYTAKMVKYWEVLPEVHNDTNTFADNLNLGTESVLKGKDWEIVRSKDRWSYDKKKLAIVDGIPYPIKIDVVFANHPKLLKVAGRISFLLHFNTGDLDLSASREDLSYVPRTINAVLERFKGIESVVEQKIQDEIDQASSYLEAVVAKNEIEQEIGFPLENSFKWKNSEVTGYELKIPIKLAESEDFRLEFYEKNRSNLGYTRRKKHSIDFSKNHSYVINKDSQVSTDNLTNLLNQYNECYILTSRSKDIDTLLAEFKSQTGVDYNDLDPLNLDDFKSATPAQKIKRPKTNAYVLVAGYYWEKKLVDTDKDKGYYVILTNKKSQIQLSENAPICDRDSFFQASKDLDKKQNELIIGIKPEQVPAFKKGFKSVEQAFLELKETLEKEDLVKLHSVWLEKQNKNYQLANEERNILKIINLLKLTDEPLFDATKLFDEQIKKAEEVLPVYRRVTAILGKAEEFHNVKASTVITALIKDFNNKYPLLKFVDWHATDVIKIHVKQYIELINKELQGE